MRRSARANGNGAGRIRFVPAEGEPKAAIVNSPKVVLSGSQVSYGYEEAASRLAFERLQRSLEAAGVGRADTAFAQYYPVGEPIAAQIRKLAPGFFPRTASSILLFENLPSTQAGFGVDVIAAKD